VAVGALLLAGFWNKKLGTLGALGSVVTFLCTVTIIPFMPDGCAPSAGGFPAMVGNVAFLMKDLVLLAVSFYLLNHISYQSHTDKKCGCKAGSSDAVKQFTISPLYSACYLPLRSMRSL
jgi:uncharacterized membrane protein YkgB